MKTTAKLRHLRMSPRKVRLVADVIRGRSVVDAQNQLRFMDKRAAQPMLKVLNSAIANAENNNKLTKDNLFISELRVDEGPTLKRWMPRAFGRASAINKRTSHISIILDEKGTGRDLSDEGRDLPDKKDKKIDKDVEIVKSLDEIKEMDKKLEIEKGEIKGKDNKKPEMEKVVNKIKDIQREGSDRGKQHLDTIRKKDKAGALKRMFRRKSV